MSRRCQTCGGAGYVDCEGHPAGAVCEECQHFASSIPDGCVRCEECDGEGRIEVTEDEAAMRAGVER